MEFVVIFLPLIIWYVTGSLFIGLLSLGIILAIFHTCIWIGNTFEKFKWESEEKNKWK